MLRNFHRHSKDFIRGVHIIISHNISIATRNEILYLMVWLCSRRSNKCTLRSFYRYFTCVTRGVALFIFQGNFFMILDLLFSRLKYITFKTKLIYRYSKCFTRYIIGGKNKDQSERLYRGIPSCKREKQAEKQKTILVLSSSLLLFFFFYRKDFHIYCCFACMRI